MPNPNTVYTLEQIAHRLSHGNEDTPAPTFDLAPGGVLGVDLSALTAEGRTTARLALEAWTAVTGLVFDETAAAPSITFDDNEPGAFSRSSYTFPQNDPDTRTLVSATVNVSTDWLDQYSTDFGGYSVMTYIHEIGHALGLDHPGNYVSDSQYGRDNLFANDSWQTSVMSYFDQTENTYTDASYAYLVTPMAADVMAIRALYGTIDVRTGDTVYGDNSTAGGPYDQLAALRAAGLPGGERAWTIVDDGGVDTLDLRSSGADQVVDLRPGRHSDVYGLIGNLALAPGTLIERIMTGAGADLIHGHDAANVILTGGGSDTVYGGAGDDEIHGEGAQPDSLLGNGGNDTIFAGSGNDMIAGGADDDALYGGVGDNTVYLGLGNDLAGGGAGNDLILAGAGANRIWGGYGNDTVYGGAGDDTLNGGGDGRNLLQGAGGNDVVVAGGGQDMIAGGAGDDALYGGVGNNTVYLGLGNDLAGGGAGDDTIFAGAGDNWVYGGAGNDTIFAGVGKDVMNGGPGADTFVFNSAAQAGIGAARDVITDFAAGVDKINLDPLNLTFIGTAPFTGAAGQLAYVTGGSTGFLVGDIDGDGVADFAIEISGAPAIGAGDLIL